MKIIKTYLLILLMVLGGLTNLACPSRVTESKIKTGLQIAYTLSEQTRELNKQVNRLYTEGKVSREHHDSIVQNSLRVFDGIDFVNERAKEKLTDLENGVITEKSFVQYLQTLISEEVIVPLNRMLVSLRVLSPENAAILSAIISAVRALASDIIGTANLKNVAVVEV